MRPEKSLVEGIELEESTELGTVRPAARQVYGRCGIPEHAGKSWREARDDARRLVDAEGRIIPPLNDLA